MPEQEAAVRDINWPDEYGRTPSDERGAYPGDFSVTRKEAFESIVDEFERWGAFDIDVETASQHYADRPNIPHQHDRPDDPGVVVRFRHEDEDPDEELAFVCDRWGTQLENARALALFVQRQRLAERCGVTTARSISALGRLPPGNPETAQNGHATPVPPAQGASGEDHDPMDGRDPHEVLDVTPDAPESIVDAAVRAKKKEYHPDGSDPDREEWLAVQAAEEAMLDE